MEPAGVKTVLFGVGGAGVKVLAELEGKVPASTDLLALDTDNAQLDSLSQGITTICLAGAEPEEMKASLQEKADHIESVLSGAQMAVIMLAIGGTTGECIGNELSRICSKAGVFTISVVFCSSGKQDQAEICGTTKSLKETSSGVIIFDNNPERLGLSPSVKLFDYLNAVAAQVVYMLVASVSDIGTTNLSKDELAGFFDGGLFFVATHGKGAVLGAAVSKAIEGSLGYADSGNLKKIMLLVSAPSDVNVADMKDANGAILEMLKVDDVKWVCTASEAAEIDAIMLSGASELPVLPKAAKREAEKAPESPEAMAPEAEPGAAGEAEEKPAHAEKPAPKWPNIADIVKKTAESFAKEDAAYARRENRIEKPEEEESAAESSDLGELADELERSELEAGGLAPGEFGELNAPAERPKSPKLAGLDYKPPVERPRSPKLIGIKEEKKESEFNIWKRPGKGEEGAIRNKFGEVVDYAPVEEDPVKLAYARSKAMKQKQEEPYQSGDIADMVSELSNPANYQTQVGKKGQKNLGDYDRYIDV